MSDSLAKSILTSRGVTAGVVQTPVQTTPKSTKKTKEKKSKKDKSSKKQKNDISDTSKMSQNPSSVEDMGTYQILTFPDGSQMQVDKVTGKPVQIERDLSTSEKNEIRDGSFQETKMEVDHTIPVALGGTDAPTNLSPLKSKKTAWQWVSDLVTGKDRQPGEYKEKNRQDGKMVVEWRAIEKYEKGEISLYEAVAAVKNYDDKELVNDLLREDFYDLGAKQIANTVKSEVSNILSPVKDVLNRIVNPVETVEWMKAKAKESRRQGAINDVIGFIGGKKYIDKESGKQMIFEIGEGLDSTFDMRTGTSEAQKAIDVVSKQPFQDKSLTRPGIQTTTPFLYETPKRQALLTATAPIRWTGGSLARFLVSLELERVGSDARFTPETELQEFFMGQGDFERITASGDLYGATQQAVESFLEERGISYDSAHTLSMTSAIVLGMVFENPFMSVSSKPAKEALEKALKESLERELGAPLTKEGVELLKNEVDRITKLTTSTDKRTVTKEFIETAKSNPKRFINPREVPKVRASNAQELLAARKRLSEIRGEVKSTEEFQQILAAEQVKRLMYEAPDARIIRAMKNNPHYRKEGEISDNVSSAVIMRKGGAGGREVIVPQKDKKAYYKRGYNEVASIDQLAQEQGYDVGQEWIDDLLEAEAKRPLSDEILLRDYLEKNKEYSSLSLRVDQLKEVVSKEYLEGIKTGAKKAKTEFKEKMKYLNTRREKVAAAKEYFGLSDADVRRITKRDVKNMTDEAFNKFMNGLMVQAEKESNRLAVLSQVQNFIKTMELRKVENLQRAMKLPKLENMTINQLQELDEVLSKYQFRDTFLSQRKLETVKNTRLDGIKTFREAKERLAQDLGIELKDLEKIKVTPIDLLRYDTALAEKHPFYKLMVDEFHKADILAQGNIIEIEKMINHFIGAARKSRPRSLLDRLIPQDKRITEYIEDPTKNRKLIDSVEKVDTSPLALEARKYSSAEEFIENSPLVVHHGTVKEFADFDESFLGSATGADSAKEGFFFASNKDVAESYADEVAKIQADGTIEKLKARMAEISGEDATRAMYAHSVRGKDYGEEFAKLADEYSKIEGSLERASDDVFGTTKVVGSVKSVVLDMKKPFTFDADEAPIADIGITDIVKKAKAEGYDGVIVKNTFDSFTGAASAEPTDVLVVFDKSQIKDAETLWKESKETIEKPVESSIASTGLDKMTKEELDASEFIRDVYSRMRDYLAKQDPKRAFRENYYTHIRRDFLETVREDGFIKAAKEVLKQQVDDRAMFNIIGDTGEVLPLEKFFQYSLRRSGELEPSKNVAKAVMAYVKAFEKKRAFDQIIPLIDIYAQALTPQKLTPRGLEFDRSLKTFVNQWINNKKGRRIDFNGLVKQGGNIEAAIRLGRMFTSMLDLGLSVPAGIASNAGELGMNFVSLGERRFVRGAVRMRTKQGKQILKSYEGFIGRNPWTALADKSKNIGSRFTEGLFILFRDAQVRANKQYLLGSLTKEELQSGVISPDRLAAIQREMGRWRVVEDSSSIVGSTQPAGAVTQYKKWAVPILRTTINNIDRLRQMPFKDILTSKEAQELIRAIVVLGGTATAITMIWDNDKPQSEMNFVEKLAYKAVRDMASAIAVFDPKFLFAKPRLFSFLEEVAKGAHQLILLEKYQSSTEFYEEGELKGVNTFKRILTPQAFKQFQKGKQPSNTEKLLIDEAERISALPKDQRKTAIETFTLENPELGERLSSRVDDMVTGITEEEKKIRELGVTNGERSLAIKKELDKLDPQAKALRFNEYVEKKVISQRVANQLIARDLKDELDQAGSDEERARIWSEYVERKILTQGVVDEMILLFQDVRERYLKSAPPVTD